MLFTRFDFRFEGSSGVVFIITFVKNNQIKTEQKNEATNVFGHRDDGDVDIVGCGI